MGPGVLRTSYNDGTRCDSLAGGCRPLSEVIAVGKARRASAVRTTMAWLVRELPHVTLAALSTQVGRDITTLRAAATRLQQRAGTDRARAQR